MQFKLNLIVGAAVAMLAGTSMAQDMVVKIGHVGPVSGGQAHYGKDNENGARMAVEDLNAKGVTIGGKKVRMSWVPNTYAGGQAYFVITTDTGVKFFRNAPSLAKLVNSTWDPLEKGKLNFKSTNAPSTFNRLNVSAITPPVDTQKCKP